MHRKIMRFLVNFSLIFGVIIAYVVASLVGGALNNSGIGVLTFIVTLVIIELGLASEGMKVEQAENIEKIVYNTEQLLRIQQVVNSGNTYNQTSMLSRAVAADPIAYNAPVQKQTPVPAEGPSSWMCRKCLEKNAASSQFCMYCGNRKSY